jgi:hypothetical protein
LNFFGQRAIFNFDKNEETISTFSSVKDKEISIFDPDPTPTISIVFDFDFCLPLVQTDQDFLHLK